MARINIRPDDQAVTSISIPIIDVDPTPQSKTNPFRINLRPDDRAVTSIVIPIIPDPGDGVQDPPAQPPTEPPIIGVPNPAAKFCGDHGGEYDLNTGRCVFPGGSCDGWELFRGEVSLASCGYTGSPIPLEWKVHCGLRGGTVNGDMCEFDHGSCSLESLYNGTNPESICACPSGEEIAVAEAEVVGLRAQGQAILQAASELEAAVAQMKYCFCGNPVLAPND
jgi:putative hemolysin